MRILFFVLMLFPFSLMGQNCGFIKSKIITSRFSNGCDFKDSSMIIINDTIKINFISEDLNNINLNLKFKKNNRVENYYIHNIKNLITDSTIVSLQLEIDNMDSIAGDIQTYFDLGTGAVIGVYSEGTEQLCAYLCKESNQMLIRCVVIPHFANMPPRELFQIILKLE